MRDENDDPIQTYKDKYMRWSVRRIFKVGRCTAFIHYCESKLAEKIFRTISEELNVKGNICLSIEANVKNMNKEKKSTEKDYDSDFDDYRKNNEKRKEKNVKNQLNKLPVLEKLKKSISSDVLMDFAAFSLYPWAIWDEKSIDPKTETG